jgi:hypothetical protein
LTSLDSITEEELRQLLQSLIITEALLRSRMTFTDNRASDGYIVVLFDVQFKVKLV